MESLGDNSGEGVTEEEIPSLTLAINGSAIRSFFPNQTQKLTESLDEIF